MSKPRRTKGANAGQEPKPTFDPGALRAVKPITDTAIPAAAVSRAAARIGASGRNGVERPAPGDAAVIAIPEGILVPSRADAEPHAPADSALLEVAETIAVPGRDDAEPPVPAEAGEPVAAAPNANPNAVGLAAFAPERFDVVGIGSTIAHYVRGEGEAAVAHIRALTDANSPAELVRLQMGEVQRAADASLTCWTSVVWKASRVIAFP